MSKPASPVSHKPPYRGRFAPSPTGPLHFGSLIAAMGSYLMARQQQGEWWLRIDDIDPPREMAGASDAILRTLEAFGFEWDGPVSYQSQHHEHYHAALAQLKEQGHSYPCGCTRKIISETQQKKNLHVYPGTCRHGLVAGKQARMTRINTVGARVTFQDRFHGECVFELEKEIGDFVVLRADGHFAYQLATGIDDAMQGITEVIRGSDLLDSTPCQIYVQQCLGLASPAYGHLPLALNAQGQKLSKQNLATPLENNRPGPALWQALKFLGQNVPDDYQQESVNNLWKWASHHWQVEQVPLKNTVAI